MGVQSIMKAYTVLFEIFVVFTTMGVLLTVILVHVEPLLLPTFSSEHMLMEYLKWREWLAWGINLSAYSLSVVISYIILMGGIRLASNTWREEV